MFSSFLVVSRESFEAVMIIAIILGFLTKTKQTQYKKYVWSSVALGLILTGLIVYILKITLGSYTNRAEGFLGGPTLIISSLFILSMVIWMAKTGASAGNKLKEDLIGLVESKRVWGLMFLVTTAILREGIETFFFLLAVIGTENSQGILIGSLLGLLTSLVIGYLMVKGAIKINMSSFFKVFSYLLILISAGFFAHGIKKLQSVETIPTIIKKLWDTTWLIDKHSLFGGFFKGMFSYDPKPSLMSLCAYILFLFIGFYTYNTLSNKNK
ncbi:MAG: FTR1 family protein [Psychrilyobacter sp.]|uniref:FTR1 family iron permease n=1 Tax=Psychrilyobacter sp. TaxID=2586924 RepID=UPI003C755385